MSVKYLKKCLFLCIYRVHENVITIGELSETDRRAIEYLSETDMPDRTLTCPIGDRHAQSKTDNRHAQSETDMLDRRSIGERHV